MKYLSTFFDIYSINYVLGQTVRNMWLDESLVADLIKIFDNHNVLAKSFRSFRDSSLEI